MEQKEVPQGRPKREPVEEYRGYRIYVMDDGQHEAFMSSAHVVIDRVVSKVTGEEKDVLKPTKSERLVLPTTSIEEARAMIDNKLRKVKKVRYDPNSTPKLF